MCFYLKVLFPKQIGWWKSSGSVRSFAHISDYHPTCFTNRELILKIVYCITQLVQRLNSPAIFRQRVMATHLPRWASRKFLPGSKASLFRQTFSERRSRCAKWSLNCRSSLPPEHWSSIFKLKKYRHFTQPNCRPAWNRIILTFVGPVRFVRPGSAKPDKTCTTRRIQHYSNADVFQTEQVRWLFVRMV